MSLKEKNYLQCSARHTHSRSSVFKFALSYSSNSALKTRPTTKDLNNLAGWAPPACVSYCGPCLAGKWTVKGIDRRWVCLHLRNMKYRVQIYCCPFIWCTISWSGNRVKWVYLEAPRWRANRGKTFCVAAAAAKLVKSRKTSKFGELEIGF